MTWLRLILDLVLPRACAGCGREWAAAALCPACLPGGPLVPAAAGALAATAYEGAVRAALLRYKERGRRDLAPALAVPLARAVAGVLVQRPPPVGAAVLVPVPSARAAAAARGGDHVLRLARHAAREVGVPVATPLRLTRAVLDSAGLAAAQRARERDGSMAARPPGPLRRGCPAPVAVVVDDIVTTGATLREARRALGAAGWTVAGAAAVAATPRDRPTRTVTTGTPQVIGLA